MPRFTTTCCWSCDSRFRTNQLRSPSMWRLYDGRRPASFACSFLPFRKAHSIASIGTSRCFRPRHREDPMDLRKSQRFPVHFRIFLMPVGAKEQTGTVVDLSLGGCRIRVENPVLPGIHVALSFD